MRTKRGEAAVWRAPAWFHCLPVSPDVVATVHVGVGANKCICYFVIQGIVRSVLNTFPLFV